MSFSIYFSSLSEVSFIYPKEVKEVKEEITQLLTILYLTKTFFHTKFINICLVDHLFPDLKKNNNVLTFIITFLCRSTVWIWHPKWPLSVCILYWYKLLGQLSMQALM